MAKIVVKDLNKYYDNGFHAVKDVNFTAEDKEFVVLVGPSGCGKSTVLRLIAGLEEISSGDIYIGDKLVNHMPPKERDIAMVFQNYALYPHMTVYDNMAFALKLRGENKADITRKVDNAAEMLGIQSMMKRKPGQLSGGQRQRVAMGRAIVRQPAVYLMDEPLSNLDAKLRVQMRAEIAQLQHRLGTTTVYVTHDQVEAMTMGHRVALMRDGILQQVDTPAVIYNRPRNLFAAAFIGAPTMNLFSGELTTIAGEPAVRIGSHTFPIPASVLASRAALGRREAGRVIIGFRPEDIHDAVLRTDLAATGRMEAIPDLVEALGSDVLVHFGIDAPTIAVQSSDSLQQIRSSEAAGTAIARLSPRSEARLGQPLNLVVDTEKLHFFDPETDEAIYG